MANRVIIVDRWWNSAKERQAFGRVFRHGQKKLSHLVRIISQEVDPEIIQLQQEKAIKIDDALQDNVQGFGAGRLEPEELMELLEPVEQQPRLLNQPRQEGRRKTANTVKPKK